LNLLKKYPGSSLLISSVAISFLGSLPPGTTNVLTLQLASQNIYKSILFSAGCLCGEMIYVSLCVVMMNRILKFQWIMRTLEWISFSVILALAIASFTAAIRHTSSAVANVGELVSLPFFSGLLLMIINPVQIPFWLGWTTVLIEKNILQSRLQHHIIYVLGSGIGSLLASLLFVLAGDVISRQFTTSGQTWHYILGSFFLASAIVQLRHILIKRSLRINSELKQHSF
jgi:threonine/homoserine/homoserine lactone efflux protein